MWFRAFASGVAAVVVTAATAVTQTKAASPARQATPQQAAPAPCMTDKHARRWAGDTLVFLAHSRNARGKLDQRLSFSPVDSSAVRQFGEISTDGGRSWSVGYDFRYHRRK
jgi:hypothetical protein